MILDAESWMNIRRFRVLHEAGATYAEIAREVGCDWRTVKKYLDQPSSVRDEPAGEGVVALPPTAPSRAGTQPQKIEPLKPVIDAWLRADTSLRASVIHERLVAEYAFSGNYQRTKLYVRQARERIRAELGEADENELAGLHRRFEVVPGAQAQVDWGDEGAVLAAAGIQRTYSFHMTLSYSREPFCCFTSRMDAATFWACHRRAFTHCGGVPAAVVYDRVKTVVRRHVAPGQAVALHPEAAAFAGHYGFVLDPLAAYRPTGKGRVERQVRIVREHVLAGRRFASLAELDAAFTDWLVIRLGQVHRTHGEVIGERGRRDRAALRPLPALPYLVADRHLRRVGKDALVSFDGSLYSVPARQIRAGQRVEVRVQPEGEEVARLLSIHALDGALLAVHHQADRPGSWVTDERHWDGLPDGHTRATVIELHPGRATSGTSDAHEPSPGPDLPDLVGSVVARHNHADVQVARRPLSDYAAAAFAATTGAKEVS